MEIIKDLEELETNTDLIEAYDHESSYAEARYIRGCEEGEEKGIKKGRKEGERQTFLRIIRSMLQKGRDYDEISDTLELSVAEVKKYAQMI